MYQARDFIVTPEGLVFAVTLGGTEEGRIIACLRYVPDASGLRKVDSGQAQALLRECHPLYLHYSEHRDVHLQAVPIGCIDRHLKPRKCLNELLSAPEHSLLTRQVKKLVGLLTRQGVPLQAMGITGSLLAGTGHRNSDIDLVIYGDPAFELARRAIRRLTREGRLQPPSLTLWKTTWRRRGCPLSFPEYLWHERRKFNKGAIDGTKFDLVLVQEDQHPEETGIWRKQGRGTIQAMVTDASQAFANPARFRLDHPSIPLALSFTATYLGQARTGETVEISGFFEHSTDGERRIVVGSSREAPGEYIKVIHS